MPSFSIANPVFSSKEEVRANDIDPVVMGVALAVLLGSIAVIGAILLGIGSFASMGTLPLVVILTGAIISTAASILIARIEIQLAKLKEYDPEEIPEIKLGALAALTLKGEFHFDLCKFQGAIHPHFERDCVRDRSKLSIGVLTFNEMFPEEFAQIEKLKESCACLQKKAKASGDESIQEQADTTSKSLEACDSDLRKKMIQKLTDVVTEKLGANSPLLTPISLALCQDSGNMLNDQMKELFLRDFNMRLTPRGTDPKISYTYALEFPQDEAAVVRITVKGQKYFHSIFQERNEYRVEPPCSYRGEMYISIDSAGKTSIEKAVYFD
jgi:hypothetical protein